MIIMVRKEKKCNLCTRIKVLPISPVRTWLRSKRSLHSLVETVHPELVEGWAIMSIFK